MTEMNWYRIWACLNIGSPRSFRYISLSWVTQWITQSQVSNGLCPKSAGFALQFWPRNPKDHREIMGNVIFIHFLRNAKLGGGWNLLVPESSGPDGLSLIQTGSSCHQPRSFAHDIGHESKIEAIGTASTIQFLSISEMPKLSHPILTPIVRQKSNFESNLEGN